MKKNLILSALVAALWWPTQACAEVDIHCADRDTTIQVASIKDISFQGNFHNGRMLINYTDGQTATYRMEDITHVQMKRDEPQETDAVMPAPSAGKGSVAAHGNMLVINGISGTAILYNANGQKIQQCHLQGETCVLQLSGLPTGTYILKVNEHTLKVNKK